MVQLNSLVPTHSKNGWRGVPGTHCSWMHVFLENLETTVILVCVAQLYILLNHGSHYI